MRLCGRESRERLAVSPPEVKVGFTRTNVSDDSGYFHRYIHSVPNFIVVTHYGHEAPTPEMQEYAARASLGDDVYHEPTTQILEAAMARLTGKEAALFMPSGTMSNQIGLRTHLKQPPYSIICDHRAHIHNYEAGGVAFHSGATVIPVQPQNSECG